jgi:2-keto-4-pentenoate hydratase/2-oxohepta-3-ene-1,7-dioic acid hydratase in catechol pathway
MTSRRNFLLTAGALTTGLASMATGEAMAADVVPPARPGGDDLPRDLTLLAIRNADGSESLGIRTADGIVDVRAAGRQLGIRCPLTLEQMLREGTAAQLNALRAAALRSKPARAALLPEKAITHGRLFTNPGKIICIGLNYRAHASEAGAKPPTVPILFNKYNNALAGHNCTIQLPPREVSWKFDYETELLVVIGKPTRNVSEAEALSHVAGYCTGQDFSARDLQLELSGGQWMAGKTLDNFGPIGPYFVSADLVGDPGNLRLETYVNGERRQSANTGEMIFSPQQIIAYVSRLWTLEPGDILFTGTPEGVIMGMPKDKQVWLKAGDKITSSIEKLGELAFTLA